MMFDALISEPETTIGKIMRVLNVDPPNRLSDSITEIEKFLEPDLKHFKQKPDEEDNELPDSIADYFQALSRVAGRESIEADDILRLDHIKDSFIRDYRFFYNSEVVQIERTLFAMNKEVDRMNKEVDRMNKEVFDKNRIIEETRALVRNREYEIGIILNSTSWRITAPFRSVMTRVKRTFGKIWVPFRKAVMRHEL